MKTRPLGRTGLMVSEIGLGALEIGRDWAADVNPDPRHLTAGEAAALLHGALDAGINFIDTAPAYWHSEEFIGAALSGRRDEFVLATKVGELCDAAGSVYDYSRKATLDFVDQSLQRLRTDRIDLLQIHSASIEVLERGETYEAMDEARRAGKVLHLGMTGGVAECIRALEMGGYETVQVPYNLLNLAAEERLLPLAREKSAGVIIMRPLAGGKLTDKHVRLADDRLRQTIAGFLRFTGKEAPSLAHLALAYVLSRPEVSCAIPGSRRLEAIRDNIAAAARPLSPELVEAVRAYAAQAGISAW